MVAARIDDISICGFDGWGWISGADGRSDTRCSKQASNQAREHGRRTCMHPYNCLSSNLRHVDFIYTLLSRRDASYIHNVLLILVLVLVSHPFVLISTSFPLSSLFPSSPSKIAERTISPQRGNGAVVSLMDFIYSSCPFLDVQSTTTSSTRQR